VYEPSDDEPFTCQLDRHSAVGMDFRYLTVLGERSPPIPIPT
jgi:hypothetical protein